ncbi:YihY/virulence factor BrkB family protein [Roseibium algae]|uniref:YihY/virulence factor BrkB family protein n=1 Tax=Roseibium algae TaxID=3123038 RepID=A0ABU8TGC1_9HYPH
MTKDSSATPSALDISTPAAAESGTPPKARKLGGTMRKIPPRGWAGIGVRISKRLKVNRVAMIAAGSAFFIILSIVPALAALVSLYGLLTDPTSLAQQVDNLKGMMPSGGLEIIREELVRLTNRPDKSLGLSFATSIAFAIWSSNRGITALFQAMNVVSDAEETRSFLHIKFLTLMFTFCTIVFGVILINSAVFVPLAFKLVGLGSIYKILAGFLLPLTVVLSAIVGISALYRWGPSEAPVGWRLFSAGSIASALGIVLVSTAYAYFLSNFGDYGATYGSLGAMIGLMIWIFLSTYVVLIGAELNAEIAKFSD